MSNVVALQPSRAPAYNAAQLDLIRRTVAADCNKDEFDLFCTVVRNTGLDPFRKQIYALVYNKDNNAKRRMSIITGIDGMRAVAARSGRYRPDEDEPSFEYDAELKGHTNPLGLVKASVRIWIKDIGSAEWRPVAGWAYWDEFAPVADEWAYDEQKGKRQPTGKLKLEGQWPKMGRVMLAKCAEAQALRRAFPEDLSSVYEAAELDQARDLEDWTPTEIVEKEREHQRLTRIGGSNAVLFQVAPGAALQHIPLGQIADRILEATRDYTCTDQLDWFESVNHEALRDWWARAPGDALEIKKRLAEQRAKLGAAQ